MTDTLQLSGNENVWISDEGVLQIFGAKIASTELETQVEIVGIQYPPEFAIQLLDFLKKHELDLMDNIGADMPSNEQEPFFDADEDNDLDGALFDNLKTDDFDDEDDSFDNDEISEDPYSPGYEAD